MIDIEFDNDIFNKSYLDFVDDNTRTQIIFGGASAGKSVFVAQRCIYDLMKGGRNYLCCRKVGRTIRNSIFNELTKFIVEMELGQFFQISKTDMTITCGNGYQAIMAGLDDTEKIKSITPKKGVITDIWIEEATETVEDDVKQLRKRLRGIAKGIIKRIILTFNPILRTHWIYKRYFSKFGDEDKIHREKNLLIARMTYKDNEFLEPDDIAELEDESDEYFYQVYTLGLWGVLGDLIFKNWKKVDVLNDPIFETFDIFKNGLDFGFSNNPTAFVRLYYQKARKRIYIFKDYENYEITNEEIARDLKPFVNGDHIVGDSAEPKSIKELNNYGLHVIGAKKGKDSVLHGIQWLKQHEIFIDKSCQSTINNFQQYHWKKDREGNVLNVPVDRNNDFIDALRYALEDEMLLGDIEVEAFGETLSSQGDW